MMLEWLQWSNPVAVWWAFLLVVSSANIALWLLLHFQLRKSPLDRRWTILRVELMVLLCAAYVFGCAFRSVLPRADVQRICLFDTWLSSVLVGRSVATIAEICFVVQWAIVLRQLGRLTGSDTARNVGTLVVPMIFVAEACSWFAVITTNYLGNTIENSIWAVTFTLIAIALLRLFREFRGFMQWAIGTAVVGILAYVTFLVAIDVPMYFARWQADMTTGKELLGLGAGLYDLSTRWEVTSRHCALEGRDPLDVALLQRRGVVELGALQLRIDQGSLASLLRGLSIRTGNARGVPGTCRSHPFAPEMIDCPGGCGLRCNVFASARWNCH